MPTRDEDSFAFLTMDLTISNRGREQILGCRLNYKSLKVTNTIFLLSLLKIGVLVTLILLLDTEFIGIISSSIVMGLLDFSTSKSSSWYFLAL